MDIVSVEGVTKDFQAVRAVDGLSFEIRKGEIFALLGPNGAGETTAARAAVVRMVVPTVTATLWRMPPDHGLARAVLRAAAESLGPQPSHSITLTRRQRS